VIDMPPIPFTVPPPLSPVNVPPITPEPPLEVKPDEEIKVEAPRIPPSVIDMPPIPFTVPPPLSPVDVPKIKVPQTPEEKALEAKKAIDAAKAAATLLGLGSGAAGGGAGGAGNIPLGLGELNPIFSAKLPEVTTDFSARPPGDVDWATYGQRPEMSFFNYVPKKMARGGSLSVRDDAPPRQSFAVNGAGTGRSDEIPARLSDGEYVMDAETVALLGDGSSKAGARKLDDLRVNIRKQKGRNLAQGKISGNAKHPAAYLAGGRIK
ncbi:MAG: hypothetical protein WCI05_15380, partial [Myxococcales bacterium]